ncbi:MAG TPA: glycosyltransferase family 4 protein [Gemmatimonadales bacterium]|nr:glycosyltransferase family 4 protein [Gemmatimonadales bacterium]
MGWNWALQAARYHQVWVLTRANNRAAIEASLGQTEVPNLRFVYYDLPQRARFWKRGGVGIRTYYVLWQAGAYRVARRLHRRVGFHVVHHVTFNTLEVPGFLWLLPVPFVWGPVGGGQEPAPALRSYFGGRWYREQLRVLRKRLVRFNPLLRLAARRASTVLAANADTAERLRRVRGDNIVRELETAIDLPPLDPSGPASGTFTVLWTGSLILRKGAALALDALAALKRRGVAFQARFIGEGPLRQELQQRIRLLKLEPEVRLQGPVSYGEIHRSYAQSHAYLFSSLHDTSGNVLLEAMAHALPVVTLDHHGAREIVSDDAGIKIPVRDEVQVVEGLASALARLAADPALRQVMGQAGRRRVAELYSWNHKGELLRGLYARAAGREAIAAPDQRIPAAGPLG